VAEPTIPRSKIEREEKWLHGPYRYYQHLTDTRCPYYQQRRIDLLLAYCNKVEMAAESIRDVKLLTRRLISQFGGHRRLADEFKAAYDFLQAEYPKTRMKMLLTIVRVQIMSEITFPEDLRPHAEHWVNKFWQDKERSRSFSRLADLHMQDRGFEPEYKKDPRFGDSCRRCGRTMKLLQGLHFDPDICQTCDPLLWERYYRRIETICGQRPGEPNPSRHRSTVKFSQKAVPGGPASPKS
jgi:hypothetical protein